MVIQSFTMFGPKDEWKFKKLRNLYKHGVPFILIHHLMFVVVGSFWFCGGEMSIADDCFKNVIKLEFEKNKVG